jgi:Tfp pilus assembly protein PilX
MIREKKSGYVMMLALVLMAVLSVIGATTLSLAGVDNRIAVYNRLHMVVMNAAHAGTEHARNMLENENPTNENLDSAGDTWAEFVQATEAEASFEGISFASSAQNLGVYWVEAVYQKCSQPPPGYSTELGNQGFRSDFWNMESTARLQDSSYANVNEAQGRAVATLRKIVWGACKIR